MPAKNLFLEKKRLKDIRYRSYVTRLVRREYAGKVGIAGSLEHILGIPAHYESSVFLIGQTSYNLETPLVIFGQIKITSFYTAQAFSPVLETEFNSTIRLSSFIGSEDVYYSGLYQRINSESVYETEVLIKLAEYNTSVGFVTQLQHIIGSYVYSVLQVDPDYSADTIINTAEFETSVRILPQISQAVGVPVYTSINLASFYNTIKI